MIAAALCWSTGGIFVRNVATPDGFEIVFWRSLFMVAFLFAVLAWWHRGAVWSKIAAVGRAGLLSGALLAATFFCFILSITRNTAANTFVPGTLALGGAAIVLGALLANEWAGLRRARRGAVAGLTGIQ